MVRIAQGLLHMGKGTLTVNPFHTDRQVLSRVAAAGLLTVMVSLIDAREFAVNDTHYLLYLLAMSVHPRWLMTVDEELKPISVNVRVGQAVDVVGQAGKPKTITGWQTQSTPVLLGYGERAELEDEQYVCMASTLEGVVIVKKVCLPSLHEPELIMAESGLAGVNRVISPLVDGHRCHVRLLYNKCSFESSSSRSLHVRAPANIENVPDISNAELGSESIFRTALPRSIS